MLLPGNPHSRRRIHRRNECPVKAWHSVPLTVTDMSNQRSSADIYGQLELIRSQLSRIHHDLNNPLSVISGNAELLAELSRALGVGDDLDGPIDDLTSAVDQLTENVDRLLAVRGLLNELTQQLEGTS